MPNSPQTPYSVFESLKATVRDRANLVQLTKATLVHLSHTLENMVLERHMPAYIIVGFQESTHWAEEIERYQALAELAHQILIFAGEPVPLEQPANIHQIKLRPDDRLRKEWFLIILGQDFSTVLAGLDQVVDDVDESLRRFDALWTFEPQAVHEVLKGLENILATYDPQQAEMLAAARAQFPPDALPNINAINHFSTEIIRFEDQLQHELRKLTVQLHQREALYRAIVASAEILLIHFDLQGRIILCEGKCAAYIYPDPPSLIGQAAGQFLDDRFGLPLIVPRLLAGERLMREIEVSPDLFLELYGTPLFNDEGLLLGGVIIGLDVSTRKQAQARYLAHQQTRLELEAERELGQLKTRMMTTLSHEFRTPLAMLQTASDLLQHYYDRMTPDQRQQRFDNIALQVRRMGDMLEDILFILQNAAGYSILQTDIFDLQAFADELVQQVAAVEAQPRISFSAEGDLSAVELDPRFMRYIILNLLTNALKYSDPPAPVTLKIYRPTPQEIILEVLDQGIGIPPKHQENIFDPFYRADNVGNIGGTGMGLTIVRDSVWQHGGEISIISSGQSGTHFIVRIPQPPNPPERERRKLSSKPE